jgi:hypothetical protein
MWCAAYSCGAVTTAAQHTFKPKPQKQCWDTGANKRCSHTQQGRSGTPP